MRIAFIVYQGNPSSGGQGVFTYYLSRELTRLGHEVHVIAGRPYPEVDDAVHLHKLKTYRIWDFMADIDEYRFRTNPLLFFHPVNMYEMASTRLSLGSLLFMFSMRAYYKLHELAQEQPFDLVHDNQTLSYGILLMKAKGLPVVASIHHPLTIDRRNRLLQVKGIHRKALTFLWFPWVMQDFTARRLDRIITCSDNSAATIQKELDLPPGKLQVIHYGADTDVFKPLDDVEKLPNSILFVGDSEDRNKGALYLLEALHTLRHRLPFRMTFVDHRPPPHLKLVQRLMKQYRLYNNIEILPRATTEDLVRLYNRTQVVVSPSLYEGFGLPAVEAMACGVPVIATRAGALSEIIEDGVTGLLVPPADPGALSEALRLLLSDPDLCCQMGQAGRERVLKNFTWRRTAERMAQAYEEVRREAAQRGPA
jgi:glycosyltransferase involved in cell wall biosynthesis